MPVANYRCRYGLTEKPVMNLADVELTDQVSRHGIDGHEIDKHKSQQQSKLYNMLMYNNVKMRKILRKHQPKIGYR